MTKRINGSRRARVTAPSFGVMFAALALLVAPAGSVAEETDDALFEKFENFQHSDFDENSIHVDNKWLPLRPGTQNVYEGHSMEDGEQVAHRVVFIVTDLVKVIDGVRTVLCYERDFTDGELLEAEIVFFGQDKNGNVWHFGQYTEMYDEIELVGGRAWMVGHLDGARAGIMMPTDPRPSDKSYSQGFAPEPYNWTDRARTRMAGAKVEVPAGNFENVLVVEEFNAEEPDAVQLKFYAAGVGVVRVGWTGDDPDQEELKLVESSMLDAEALAEAREGALRLETRAYVYASTKPAEQRPTTGHVAPAAASGSGIDDN